MLSTIDAPAAPLDAILFTEVLKKAAATKHVDAIELRKKLLARGYDISARALRTMLFDAGHPCYHGKRNRPIIMGVAFR